MIIKCKMCGGDLEFVPGATYGTCEYCGSTSTIPQAEDESKLNRYNRANHFRRQCEFDKAVAAYEKILEQDDTDAEAHWGAVISRYGIEYVEDPATKKRIPTCHRVQVASILADADYQAAVKNAPDAASRDLYKQQAAEIAEIQKGILAISANEKPYDVFICYKETDENGQRTHDSQWAQEVYYGLTEQGYKVFFSRITLEDKLGQQYEPYIFAALNSAKVMVVIGSKPEYFNAVWVKNEWSRYLALMAKDRKRLLIPCYRDMDPYDLPEELSSLQSQDMGKIGFMQDLLRGIKKVLDVDKKPEQPKPVQQVVQQVVQTAAPAAAANTESLLRRVFMFLEDGDWASANEYCEKVLDIEPENGRAYLGKLMAELNVKKESHLSSQQKPFDSNANYQKALRYGNSELKKQLEKDIKTINDRIENERQAGVFKQAKEMLAAATDIEGCRQAKSVFESIPHFDGVKQMLAECRKKEDSIREQMYIDAVDAMKAAGNSSSEWYDVRQQLSADELKNYRDVAELYDQAENRYNEYAAIERKNAEALAAKMKRLAMIGALIAIIAAVVFLVVTKVIIPENKYKQAQALLTKKDYTGAATIFITIKGYKDVDNLLKNDKSLAAAAAALQPQFTVVTYGHYPQTKAGNDNTPIEWLVLARDGNKALLISRYALDCQKYNSKWKDMTWQKCSLRTWLNGTFLNKAFTSSEQKGIVTTNVDNSKSQGDSGYSTNGGNNTQDKVFLLSYAEAWKYFKDDNARMCAPTEYAVEQGASTSSSDKVEGKATCQWWLRSPGSDQDRAIHVLEGGYRSCSIVTISDYAVRPALWVNLESGIF